MSIRNIGICLIASAVLLSSCEEEKKDPSYVWGSVDFSADTTSHFNDEINGALAKGGEKYYGWCKLEESSFSFAIGTGAPGQLSSSGFYYEVNDIPGTPKMGVYDEDGDIPNDLDNHKAIGSMRVIYVDEWQIETDDMPEDTCYVNLFAEAKKEETDTGLVEELTSAEYGSMPFQYFVQIKCTGLDAESDNNSIMQTLHITVYFDNCST